MRVYVLVRTDLPQAQRAVQAGHALAELCYRHDVKPWIENYKTLIYLGVSGEKELKEIYDSIEFREKSLFLEPDQDNEATALAVLMSEKSNIFKKLKLLQ